MNRPRSPYFRYITYLLTAIFFLTAQVTTAETFIYIDKKPELWVYPQDPVYQAWYKHADLIKLAKRMQQGGKQQLNLFAKTSLRQMAALYEYEVVRSRLESNAGAGKNFKKSRWRQAALEYAQQLQQVSEQISETSEIVLYIEEYGEPTVVVDGKPYILTTPDLKKSGLLYTTIIEQLCNEGICIQEDEVKNPETDKSRIVINAEWKISANELPAFVSEDGLEFVFADLKNRKKKQETCLQVMRELRLISDTLNDLSKKGISIDWRALALERVSGSYGYKIIINDFGDSLVIDLIYLGRVGSLLMETIPWMRARINQQVIEHKYNQADEILSIFLN